MTLDNFKEYCVTLKPDVLVQKHLVEDKTFFFNEIKEKFEDRKGGYTRILRTGTRQGDCASMAIIELVGYEEKIETSEA